MKLHRLPLRVHQRLHQVHLPLQVLKVVPALFLVGRDECRAPAKPAQCLAERQMEIQREAALPLVVGPDFPANPSAEISSVNCVAGGYDVYRGPGTLYFFTKSRLTFNIAIRTLQLGVWCFPEV